jgi:hypothetical protein
MTPDTSHRPTIGRIVHYVASAGAHWPAIITRVWPNETVNLHVLADGRAAFHYTSAPHDETGNAISSWHWPEREEAKAQSPKPKGENES